MDFFASVDFGYAFAFLERLNQSALPPAFALAYVAIMGVVYAAIHKGDEPVLKDLFDAAIWPFWLVAIPVTLILDRLPWPVGERAPAQRPYPAQRAQRRDRRRAAPPSPLPMQAPGAKPAAASPQEKAVRIGAPRLFVIAQRNRLPKRIPRKERFEG